MAIDQNRPFGLRILRERPQQRPSLHFEFHFFPAVQAGGPGAQARAKAGTVQLQQSAIPPAQGPAGNCFRHDFGKGGMQREQTLIQGMQTRAALPKVEQMVLRKSLHGYVVTVVKVGSWGSVTLVSRSKPSCSILMCSIAMAFALASRSGIAWYSETQQR
jgi:hypothetical protein